MKIIKNINTPTGNILITENRQGQKIECLSLADYGKDVNVKADFLGYQNEIKKIKHTKLLPLTKKWVITISTQFGCTENCKFCDVPKVKFEGNATYADMLNQIDLCLKLHPTVTKTKRLNIHYARMGEPTYNRNVLNLSIDLPSVVPLYINAKTIHPVVSTMMPKNNKDLLIFLQDWCYIKNDVYKGEAGLQFSINSTNNIERERMFSDKSMKIEEISKMVDKYLPDPIGRKYTLNFALADWEINAKKLADMFDTEKFIVKLTPMHKTTAAINNNIKTKGDYTTIYPYEKAEYELKEAGFDVLVFIASEEEDNSKITCGNALLALNNVQ